MTSDPQRVSEETDTSAHSYVIELMERNSGSQQSSPFAHAAQQSDPIPRDSMEDYRPRAPRPSSDRAPSMPRVDEARATLGVRTPRNTSLRSQPSPGTRMAAFREYRQQIGTRSAYSLDQPLPPRPPPPETSASNELRISMDLPANLGHALTRPGEERVRARLLRQRRRLPLPWVIGFGVVSSCALAVALTTLGIGIFNFTKLRQNRAQKSIQNLEDDLAPMFAAIRDGLAGVQLGVATLLGGGGNATRPPPPRP